MAELRIDYRETKTTGEEVVKQAQDFKTLLNQIKRTNSDLKVAWEGSDAQAYTTKVEEQAVTMDKLAQTIEEMGLFLQQVSAAYEEVMSSNMGK